MKKKKIENEKSGYFRRRRNAVILIAKIAIIEKIVLNGVNSPVDTTMSDSRVRNECIGTNKRKI